jgi:hypothetical protein
MKMNRENEAVDTEGKGQAKKDFKLCAHTW